MSRELTKKYTLDEIKQLIQARIDSLGKLPTFVGRKISAELQNLLDKIST